MVARGSMKWALQIVSVLISHMSQAPYLAKLNHFGKGANHFFHKNLGDETVRVEKSMVSTCRRCRASPQFYRRWFRNGCPIVLFFNYFRHILRMFYFHRWFFRNKLEMKSMKGNMFSGVIPSSVSAWPEWEINKADRKTIQWSTNIPQSMPLPRLRVQS